MKFSPTDQQLRAIEADPGAILVIAGPGAGKTYCLIDRIRHLLVRFDYPPERILAVTFTNKAADEISHRLRGELGPLATGVTRCTLHALCLQILRTHPEAAGLRPGFGVADDAYQAALLRRFGVPERGCQDVLRRFSRARLQGRPLEPKLERLLTAYRGVLRKTNQVDFDDLILHTHSLLETHPEILTALAGRWDVVLVDEFQDLTRTQYAIIADLAGSHRHIFAVGDDEQSIYGWAGADPVVLDRFRREFAIAGPVVLETNHRNSRVIFETARRLLRANPSLFDKRLISTRESPFAVRALGFTTDREETGWLIDDLQADRNTHGGPWGDCAILVRYHWMAERLEPELLRTGIPVRTAEGRAIGEDPIVGPVLAALRLIRHPRDSVPVELLAKEFLPEAVRETIRARFGGRPLLAALRDYGREPTTPETEARPVRRLYHHVANLPALARSARTLGDLVDTLLEQRPSRRRTRLEEQAEDLTDPDERPATRDLAAELDLARSEGRRLHLPAAEGRDIALGGMLGAAGFGHLVAPAHAGPGTADVVIDTGTPGAGLRLFKALQLLAARNTRFSLSDCVVFDVETTGLDVDTCGIIEVGAVRVRAGEIVAEFHHLVDPGRPIEREATDVHGYRDADVAGRPAFAEVWPALQAFIGDDVLVAHNAREFDIPVLRRHVRAAGGDPMQLAFFDTLPLARSVVRESAKLEHLATRFQVPAWRAHHALEDARALVAVLAGLLEARAAFHRKTAFTAGIDWLGLALALDRGEPSDEERLLLEIARVYTLGRYSDCLERYEAARRDAARADAPPIDELIERLGGRRLMARIRARRSAADRYPSSVLRLRRLLGDLEARPVAEGIDRVLDMVALAKHEGAGTGEGAVSLLTLHATKGLEFSRVYIVGVEDHQIPGYHAIVERRDDEFPEARRLLYVGMTRARDRLVLTRVAQRGDRPTGGTMLLDEMGLVLEEAVVQVGLTIDD